MGEEVIKQEQAPTETKPEEKPIEEKKEENPPPPPPPPEEEKRDDEKPPATEEKVAEEEPPQPPPPFVLYVDLHCVGCAKKIERSIMKIRGVEGVVIDMAKNEVTIKGVVEAQAVCNMIMKKIKRSAKVLSPLPLDPGQPMPDFVTSQVSGLTTVELIVNMHCEACAGQLKKKILKMKGVQTVETELSGGKVTVTGTMDADKLVDYVYRRTKKQARIIPPPEPENPPEEPKPEDAKEPEKPNEEPKPNEENKEPKDGDDKPPAEPPNEGEDGGAAMNNINIEEESMKRMMYSNYNYTPNYYNYQPFYVIERIPPPQLFSDENPNACCIT